MNDAADPRVQKLIDECFTRNGKPFISRARAEGILRMHSERSLSANADECGAQAIETLRWEEAAEIVMANAAALSPCADGDLQGLFDRTLHVLRPQIRCDVQWLHLMVTLYQVAGAPADARHGGVFHAPSAQLPEHG